MIGAPPVNDEPRNNRVRTASQALARICSELNVPYFDSFRSLMESGVWLNDIKTVDGTHPTARGYAEWARLIEAWDAWRQWLP